MGSSLLKRAREHADLSVSDITRLTRLSPRIVSAIEDEQYERLPAGIYARTAVRAYAAAVGLDAAAVLTDLRPRLPEAPLDLLALAELRAPERHRPSTPLGPRPSTPLGALWPYRFTLAAAVDAALLLSLAGAIVFVCAAACRLEPSALLRTAPTSMLFLCSTPVVLYFWLLGATDVRTAGPWLLDVEILPRSQGPLSLGRWLSRGLLYVVREVKLAVGDSLVETKSSQSQTRVAG
jgi:Helix-turn-helix domain